MQRGKKGLQLSLSLSSPYLKRPETNDQMHVLVSSEWEVLSRLPRRLECCIIYRGRSCIILQAAPSDPSIPLNHSVTPALCSLDSALTTACCEPPEGRDPLSVHPAGTQSISGTD